jgi:uncharacterized protein
MSLKIQQNECLAETENYIQNIFEDEGSGHDWWHIHRVRNMALKLAETESGNVFIIEMAALLHDLDDWKLNSDRTDSKTEAWLNDLNISEDEAAKIWK